MTRYLEADIALKRVCYSDRAMQEHVTNVSNGARWIKPPWTDTHTVHDPAAAEHTERIFEFLEPFLRRRVTAIGKKAIRLK